MEQAINEILAYRFLGKPVYEVQGVVPSVTLRGQREPAHEVEKHAHSAPLELCAWAQKRSGQSYCIARMRAGQGATWQQEHAARISAMERQARGLPW